jgi:phage/plasmid-associated DNA primase
MDGADSAAWERILPVHLTNVLPEGERDERMKNELPRDESMQRALFCLLVDGALRFLKAGGNMPVPGELKEVREDVRSEQNPYADFVVDYLEMGEQFTFRMVDLQSALRAWYDYHNVPPSRRLDDARLIARALRAHYGLKDEDERGKKLKSDGRNYWSGARVRSVEEVLRRENPAAPTREETGL